MSYDHRPPVKRMRNDNADPLHPPPSPVVFLRGLPEGVVEQDLIDAFRTYGTINDIVMMPNRRQALVEFRDVKMAKQAVTASQNGQIQVCGRAAQCNFSTSQNISRPTGAQPPGPTTVGSGSEADQRSENKVLLFTIFNCQYPITTEVLYAICSPIGKVARIVVFRKQQVQSMVEFLDSESARRAKQQLNGADIYAGCCTLKIEYAKPLTLTVTKNDMETWDYVTPPAELAARAAAQHQNSASANVHSIRPPLLDAPRRGGGPGPDFAGEQAARYDGGWHSSAGGEYGKQGRSVTPPPGTAANSYGGSMSQRRGPLVPGPPSGNGGGPWYPPGGDPYGPGPNGQWPSPGSQWGQPPPGQPPAMPPSGEIPGGVLILYGLTNQFNADRLFNLFCQYGQVLRCKFLKSKEGSSMLQLGSPSEAQRAVSMLNGITAFGSRINIHLSRQPTLNDVPQPYDLADGTPSFKSFTTSRLQRYSNADAASKNRIAPPSRTVHFYNMAPSFNEDQIAQVFADAGACRPVKLIRFTQKSERSCSGLAEWSELNDAIEAIMLANHYSVQAPSDSRYPYVIKLAFSPSPIIEKTGAFGSMGANYDAAAAAADGSNSDTSARGNARLERERERN